MTLMRFNRPTASCQRPNTDPLSRWQAEVERFFNAPFSPLGSQCLNVWAPALDVFEDKDNLVVTLEVPGMKKDDFQIELHEGVLSISGARQLEEKRKQAPGYRTERFSGQFRRSVALPKSVVRDQVKASYKDGVLTISLPIAAEARPKAIAVSAE